MLMPRFKLDWVQDEGKYRLMLKREFQTLNSDDTAARDSGEAQSRGESDKDPAASFFRFNRNPQVSRKTEVDTYLDVPPNHRWV